MKVIILGAGQVGFGIASHLSTKSNNITVVDTQPSILQKLSDAIDIKPVVGFAAHPEVLAKAGAENADLVIAVTPSDEVNMLACFMSHHIFNVKTRIARVHHQSYISSYKNTEDAIPSLSLLISPEVEVSRYLCQSMQILGCVEAFSCLSDRYCIIALYVKENTQVLNTHLRLINIGLNENEFEIIALIRNHKMDLLNPDDFLFLNDIVYILVDKTKVDQAIELFGYQNNHNKTLTIVGGGNIGLFLAQELEKINSPLKICIIEKQKDRCREITKYLRHTHIINGDALDIDLLQDANIALSSTVLSVTEDDKINILSCLLAKNLGASRTMTLLNKSTYSGLVMSLGIDSVLNPKLITISQILSQIQISRVQNMLSIANGLAEIIELNVINTSTLIGLSVEDITRHEGILIMALVRHKQVFLRPQKIIFQSDDTLLIFATKNSIKKIEKIFGDPFSGP